MKNVSKLFTIVTATVALLVLAGCPKKPVRAVPDNTMGGAQSANMGVAPVDLGTVADPNTQLESRGPMLGTSEDDLTYRGIAELQSVYFEFDRSAVPVKEREKIKTAAEWMKKNADKRVLLEGHCDWRGTAEYNLGLGDRRATAVRKFIESLGIDSKRLEIVSKGDIDAKEGAAEADMAKDRRVEFAVFK